MKKVIKLDEPKEEKKLKPIKLTHFFNDDEWVSEDWNNDYSGYSRIVYLGENPLEDDIFSCYNKNNDVIICKGYLNDGVY